MNIYIMRHGTTVWNEKGITQGRSNNRLSKSGKQQTLTTAQSYQNTKFDVIFCSPIARAVQTANIMNKFHNVKIIKHELLTDIDQGIFTGRKFSSITPSEMELKKIRHSSCKMESFYSVEKRIKKFYENELKNSPFENILIVTHSTCASFLKSIILNQKPDYFILHSNDFNNCEIKLLKI